MPDTRAFLTVLSCRIRDCTCDENTDGKSSLKLGNTLSGISFMGTKSVEDRLSADYLDVTQPPCLAEPALFGCG